MASAGVALLVTVIAFTGTASARNGPSSSNRNALPGAPTGVTAVAGDASATVSWTPPTRSGPDGITGYVITPSIGTAADVGPVTSATVAGLTNGTSYRFTVAAVNRAGTGPASGPSNPVTPTAPVTTPPVTTTSTSPLLLPLYDASAADWQQACSSLSGTSSFVISDIGNPGGPGTSSSSSWASNIGDCGTSKVGVLGYVDTGYCQVPLATAEGQIDDWYSWYGTDGVRGIFFDEADDPTNPNSTADCLAQTSSAESYYRTLAAFVHGIAAGQTVAYNFGVNPVSNWALSSTSAVQNADIAVIFEDPYSEYVDYGGSGEAWSPASWEAVYSAQHFAVLVYDATGTNQPAATCSTLVDQHVGYAFVTPEDGWTSLPPAQYVVGETTGC